MEDDQDFFPKHNLSMTMREETYQEHNIDYDELFNTIAGERTNKTMADMKAQVDVEGGDPEDVAEQFPHRQRHHQRLTLLGRHRGDHGVGVMRRLLLWTGLDGWRAEVAGVNLAPDGMRAAGTQLVVDPVAYRLDYALDAGDRFVTRRLEVEASGEGWERRIDLRHVRGGVWTCETDEEGQTDLPPAGGDVDAVGRRSTATSGSRH